MLSLVGSGGRLCDGMTRREAVRIGGLGAFGLSLPHLLASQQARAADGAQADATQHAPRAKNCIILFLMGGPPQHSTWDPKPNAPAEIRGEFGAIDTAVPGIQICELMPHTARLMDRIAILRAMSTGDNAHSSSGYAMLTGTPHQPLNFENANPGPPNDFPSMGAAVHALEGRGRELPTSITLPNRIFNTDGSVWPGQDAGFLGKSVDPWLVNCIPAAADYKVDGLSLPDDIPTLRLDRRRTLLQQLDDRRAQLDRNEQVDAFGADMHQAFDLLSSSKSNRAFRLDLEPDEVRERYGRSQFGQSVLLARRLIEAGVKLVQVNWYRGPDEPPENPCWDSHVREAERLRNVLVPPMDQAYAALLGELIERGMLDDTLVVCMAEFGRSPKINAGSGRDHWGSVFSVALAGGGVRGGQVYGASDEMGGYPHENRVQPQDLTATVFDSLGYSPSSHIYDRLERPLPLSTGSVISSIL